MADTRRRNVNWTVDQGNGCTFEGAQLAVLMDIRERLEVISRVLQCGSFIGLPYQVRLLRIAAEATRRNTTKKKSGKTSNKRK